SDFIDLPSPATPNQIAEAEEEYRTILQNCGLLSYFTPFEKLVTLSTHIGVRKPDCRIFQAALARLGRPLLPLNRCLLITEDAFHVAKVRTYGMKALRFGPVMEPGVDFSSWNNVANYIASLL